MVPCFEVPDRLDHVLARLRARALGPILPSAARDPLVLADKGFGEWNSFRIRQIGARTWVWLNDKLVVDGAPMENYPDKAVP
jgi:hypothetical protein